MGKKIYKFTFPFKGQVKTQLKIATSRNGGKRLVKPKNVKQFENAVRTILSTVFPLEERPIEGYLRFDMVHYTKYRRGEDNVLLPEKTADLDNLFKTLADCFEPVYIKQTKLDEDGNALLTEKGNMKYEKVMVTPGVIRNDKYIMRANLLWIPVEKEEDEKIEVYISTLDEKELFLPPTFDGEVIEL